MERVLVPVVPVGSEDNAALGPPLAREKLGPALTAVLVEMEAAVVTAGAAPVESASRCTALAPP